MPAKIVEAYGYRLGFRWDSDHLRPVIESAILPNWKELDTHQASGWIGVEGLEVHDEDQLWTVARDQTQLAQRIQQLAQMKLTWGADQVVFVHAGVVLFSAGVVLIPGVSKAGKSTMVQSLVQAGGRFYSDEYAVIDSGGLVLPYPRALWTRISRQQRQATPPQQLGWTPQLGPAPIDQVLFLEYRPGSLWQPRALSVSEACQKLLDLTLCPPARRPTLAPLLERALKSATCYQGLRREAGDLVSELQLKP